ncbi:mannose/fructose/N-acetylgalactosamine-specific phosphotransferase system component IIC [Allocatelliglobosispora scoriae]|uniref:Mannose/fructose/N-acetylgalactosamine-specific phosphotransferase system component IIC n=1 Tax=Allocatelliglobosispora scoriae TaxID=643052 RepID=A0A841BMK6_9ACTN|nr:hypothetical protein [Allocatelliglobosispora scoriae]MBB5868081.1 mannose/fructose/N-acetylgalactosamine-specific phosphotransferase system component IIC [Allocatelliglobosispora scoriae]
MKWLRGALAAAGGVIVVIGFRGVWDVINGPEVWHYFRLLLAVWLVNDLLALPLAISVGWLVGRRLPAFAKPVVQSALLCSIPITLIGYAMAKGKTFNADSPSVLPRNYGVGLAISLGLVWLAAALLMAVRYRRHHQTADAVPSTPVPE